MRPISRETAAQIKTGMTETEVEAFLGGPPGNYATRPVQWDDDFEETLKSWWHPREWVSDEGCIVVRFGDTTKQVLSVEFREVFVPSAGLINRMLSWFRPVAVK